MAPLHTIGFDSLEFSWFEDVAALSMHGRDRLEEAGIEFFPETEPPFSWEGGPVSSAGTVLDDGTELWLVCDENWDGENWQRIRSDDEFYGVTVRAAPEQVDSPPSVVRALASESGLQPADITWSQTAWPEDTLAEIARRRA
jgi:hypothetical protein